METTSKTLSIDAAKLVRDRQLELMAVAKPARLVITIMGLLETRQKLAESLYVCSREEIRKEYEQLILQCDSQIKTALLIS